MNRFRETLSNFCAPCAHLFGAATERFRASARIWVEDHALIRETRREFGFKIASASLAAASSGFAAVSPATVLADVETLRPLIGKRFQVIDENQNRFWVSFREMEPIRFPTDTARPTSLPRRQALSLVFTLRDAACVPGSCYRLLDSAFGNSSLLLNPIEGTQHLEAVLN